MREKQDNAPPSVGESAAMRKQAWQQTLTEQKALAESREEDGWTVVKVRSGDTSPFIEDNRAGMQFIVPKGDANEVKGILDDVEFEDYVLYRNIAAGSLMMVLELVDVNAETAISVAADYRGTKTEQMIERVIELDAVTFRLSKLDGTVVAEFEYDHYEPILPDPDEDSS